MILVSKNCPPLNADESLTAICLSNDGVISCETPEGLEPGTTVRIQCRLGYKKKFHGLDSITCEADGRWSSTPHECEPLCGVVSADPNASTESGIPWQVIIYKQDKQDDEHKFICGGTILNNNVIVSNAHCFWDQTSSKPFDASLYKLGVGKVYTNLDAVEPNPSQILEIESIKFHPSFMGEDVLSIGDVVVLKPNKPIEFNKHIRPLCMSSRKRYHAEMHVSPGSIGIIGKCNPNTKVRSIEIETIGYDECIRDLNSVSKPFLKPDKCCVRILSKNETLDFGNSGNALSLPQRIDGITKYFFGGIVSGALHTENLIIVTNADYITDFILNEF